MLLVKVPHNRVQAISEKQMKGLMVGSEDFCGVNTLTQSNFQLSSAL
jgi:hypothetical protein